MTKTIKADPTNLEWHRARLKSRMASLVDSWRAFDACECQDTSVYAPDAQRLLQSLAELCDEGYRIGAAAQQMRDQIAKQRLQRWQREKGDVVLQ